MTSRVRSPGTSRRAPCPAVTVMLEAGGAGTYTQRAIPGSDLFCVRSPPRFGSRATRQVAMPAVLSASDRDNPQSTTSSGTPRARSRLRRRQTTSFGWLGLNHWSLDRQDHSVYFPDHRNFCRDCVDLAGDGPRRSGQAPACPLVSDRSVRSGSRVKRDFACTLAGIFPPVLVALQAQSRLGLEGRTRTLSGPSPAPSPARPLASPLVDTPAAGSGGHPPYFHLHVSGEPPQPWSSLSPARRTNQISHERRRVPSMLRVVSKVVRLQPDQGVESQWAFALGVGYEDGV